MILISRAVPAWAVLLVAGLMVVAGCARSPEAKKARHLKRGEAHFARAEYREAILQYGNALRLDATNAQAVRQLGLSHYQLGEMGHALRYLLKAQELEPDNLAVRLKLGTIYLLGRGLAEVREQASFVLTKDPKNLEALVLLAGAARTPEEVAGAIRRLEGMRADLGGRAKLHLALGTLHLRQKDLITAERSFKEAVSREPASMDARVALADFYLLRRDVPQAEREFKAAAELAPLRSPVRLKLANFYLLVGKPEEGKRVLREITEKTSDALPVWRRLAEISLAEGKHDEAMKAIVVILKKNPSDLDAHFLRGRAHLVQRKPTEAIQDFQKVLKLEPKLAPARYQLALAHLQAGNVQQAKAELREATTVAPHFVEAALVLAELNIQTGAPEPAIEALQKLLASQPGLIPAYALLGLASLVKREPVKATEAYRRIVALAPKDPRGPDLVGRGLLAQGKRGEAKREFEAALALAPGYVEPLAQLVALAFAEKQPDAALDRVRKQIARVPKSGPLHSVLGTVHLARREREQAERAYLKAVELEPRLIGPYLRLGSLYADSGKYEPALARLNEALKLNPKNVAALMLTGVVHERQGQVAKAQEKYERVLALNPRFAPAANNLAWLLVEHGGDKDRALQLAQLAKEVAPEDPYISDTLGWILYKRGIYQRAVALLKESASKLPEAPEVQYHLGLAYLKVGEKESARTALTLAARSPASFPGKEEARKAVAELR